MLFITIPVLHDWREHLLISVILEITVSRLQSWKSPLLFVLSGWKGGWQSTETWRNHQPWEEEEEERCMLKMGREGQHGWESDVNTAAAAWYVKKSVFSVYFCVCVTVEGNSPYWSCRPAAVWMIIRLQSCGFQQQSVLWVEVRYTWGSSGCWWFLQLPVSIHKVSWLRTGSMWGLSEPLFWFPHTPSPVPVLPTCSGRPAPLQGEVNIYE